MKIAYRRFKPKIPKRFDSFKMVPKNVKGFMKTVASNAALKKALDGITFKRTAYTAAGGTAVGLLANYVVRYVHNNSGCFVHTGSETCKVRELSCCQPEASEGVPFCDWPNIAPRGDPCHGFDETRAGSCCVLCNCKDQTCGAGQTMGCERATVGDALAAVADSAAKTVADTFRNISKKLLGNFSWLVGIVCVVLFGVGPVRLE